MARLSGILASMRPILSYCGTEKSVHFVIYSANHYTGTMARKASVLIEKDDEGFYARCPELKGCQSQGDTLEQAIANIKEAIELYLETLPKGERDALLSQDPNDRCRGEWLDCPTWTSSGIRALPANSG
jgi:predicted RNase H-like HicB family nuclease